MNHPARVVCSLVLCWLSACGGAVETSNGQIGASGKGGAGGTGGSGAGAGGAVDSGCAAIPCPYPGWNPQTCSCYPPLPPDQDAAVDAPASALKMSIGAIDMWVDCMPQVPPDPIGGTFTVRYDNSKGSAPASAIIALARWELPGQWEFAVEPPSSGTIPAGQVLEVVHKKVAGSAKGSGDPCAVCNGVGALRVTWDVNGALSSETKPGAPNCAY